jgi:hypothetical protein
MEHIGGGRLSALLAALVPEGSDAPLDPAQHPEFFQSLYGGGDRCSADVGQLLQTREADDDGTSGWASARPEEAVEDRPLAVSDAAGPHQLATAFGDSGGFRRPELDGRRRR